ncbi:MAG: CoA pyrophosphatase [Pseudomonadota bacterium]
MTSQQPTLDRISRALLSPPVGSSDFDLNPEVLGLLPAARQLREAAVLVPLVDRPDGMTVLLTRRSTRLRHHPGQIAFPGGKRDPDDPGLWETALREAREEIGLDPTHVAPMGVLDRHETVTRFDVAPHVGLVTGPFDVRPCEDEVAEVFEVPLDFLLDPGHYQTHGRLWNGHKRQYFAVPYGPYYIWGATARILKGLADRVRAL